MASKGAKAVQEEPLPELSSPFIGDPSATASYRISDNTKERVIYRACHPDRAKSYLAAKAPRDGSYITMGATTGDFHKSNGGGGCSYWTTDLWYAMELCEPTSVIIAITLEPNFHAQFWPKGKRNGTERTKYYQFTSASTYLWQQTVTSNRLGVDDKDPKIADLQNLFMIEGPTSNTSTLAFAKDAVKDAKALAAAAEKPVKEAPEHPGGEGLLITQKTPQPGTELKARGWQVAFRGEGLAALNAIKDVQELGTKSSDTVKKLAESIGVAAPPNPAKK